MSSHGRWEGVKIVRPLDQNREKELVGGIRNALERGESLAKAKQTFINAGYHPAEVATAVQKIPQGTAPIATPIATSPPTPPGKPRQTPKPNFPPVTPATGAPKKKSKLLLIIIIVVSALVLVSAGVLGLFWNSWFGS